MNEIAQALLTVRKMKKLYIHIGHYKTGTSSIQKYCSDNADALAGSGYFYPPVARPKNNSTNHGDLSLLLAERHGFVPPGWYGGGRDIDKTYASFLQSALEAPQENIVISSEEFLQLALRDDPAAAITELKDRLSAFEISIVFYIRDPMALVKSWYNEVNKAPDGTRPFPVFVKNINPEFLAQYSIWRHFADVFGDNAIIVRAYQHMGLRHIRDFLEVIGCPHQPVGDEPREQVAQNIEKLELIRLAKRKDLDFDAATLSRTGPIGALSAKLERITSDFTRLAAQTGAPMESTLNLANVFRHHARLIEPLVQNKCMNDKEANILRDAAIAIEETDPEAALVLMKAAHMIRPNGPFIIEKLGAYENGKRPSAMKA